MRLDLSWSGSGRIWGPWGKARLRGVRAEARFGRIGALHPAAPELQARARSQQVSGSRPVPANPSPMPPRVSLSRWPWCPHPAGARCCSGAVPRSHCRWGPRCRCRWDAQPRRCLNSGPAETGRGWASRRGRGRAALPAHPPLLAPTVGPPPPHCPPRGMASPARTIAAGGRLKGPRPRHPCPVRLSGQPGTDPSPS